MSNSTDLIEKFSFFFKIAEFKLKIANNLNDLMLLIVRFFLAKTFWDSVVLKLPSGFLGFGQGDWSSTIYLYKAEHPIPGFSPEIAAYLGTGAELLAAILLITGFGTRFGAFVAFCIALIIQLTYIANNEHISWMMLSGVLIFGSGGRYSIDFIIRRSLLRSDSYKKYVLGTKK